MAKPRTVPEEEVPVQAEQSPGAQLRAARESQGLTAQDVAARLHLDTRMIECLEADAYRELPSDAYVRGYIRTYARLVNADASPLLESYARHAEHGPALAPFASMPEPQARAGDFPVKAVTYLVVATLVALLVLWSWQTHNLSSLVTFAIPKWGQDAGTPPATGPVTKAGTPTKPASTAQAPAASATASTAATNPQPPQINYTYPVIDNSGGPAPADSGDGTQPTAAAAEPPETSATLANTVPAATATDSNDGTTAAPAAPPAAAPADTSSAGPAATGGAVAADSGNGLVLKVETGDSWIGIHDASGKKLYFNLARKGSRISVQGQLPYEVKVGRASVVTILYQNKPLDISAYTHQGVAHFQLTADGPAAP